MKNINIDGDDIIEFNIPKSGIEVTTVPLKACDLALDNGLVLSMKTGRDSFSVKSTEDKAFILNQSNYQFLCSEQSRLNELRKTRMYRFLKWLGIFK